MACTDKCHRSAKFYGFSRILLTVCRGIFKDSKSDHGIAEEEQEVCLDREMHRIFSEAQGSVDNGTDTKGP